MMVSSVLIQIKYQWHLGQFAGDETEKLTLPNDIFYVSFVIISAAAVFASVVP